MSKQDLKLKVIEQADKISDILAKGKDVELRRSAGGVSVAEISKKVIVR